MIRHVLAFAIALSVAPLAAAQSTVLTITAARADVRKAPTVASPVVGQAPQGSVLEVTREVGDWVKVSWPDAPDGIGYVRLAGGALSRTTNPAANRAGEASAPPSPLEPAAPDVSAVRADIEGVERRIAARTPAPQYVRPPTNTLGLGALVSGSTIGFGASGRVWSRGGLGAQVQISRDSLAVGSTADRVVSVHFAPSVLFSAGELLTDYVRVRPYVGVGARLSSSTLHASGSTPASNSAGSWQILGGAEMTSASAPRLALSADLRYDSSRTPFSGITFGGVGFSAAGHWYIR
jgi:SH3 domain-containing protein